MATNIRKNAEAGQVDLTATSTVYKIVDISGGQSVTIKALQGNSGDAYIGFDKLLTTSNGFQLDSSETLTLTLPISFGADNFITAYAVTSNAGDDVCFVKLIDLFAETAGAG